MFIGEVLFLYAEQEEFSSVDASAQSRRQGQESEEIPSIVGAELMSSGMRSPVLPLYVYNCPLGIITEQLLNRWTYERPRDIYEDLTFEVAIISLFNVCEVVEMY